MISSLTIELDLPSFCIALEQTLEQITLLNPIMSSLKELTRVKMGRVQEANVNKLHHYRAKTVPVLETLFVWQLANVIHTLLQRQQIELERPYWSTAEDGHPVITRGYLHILAQRPSWLHWRGLPRRPPHSMQTAYAHREWQAGRQTSKHADMKASRQAGRHT